VLTVEICHAVAIVDAMTAPRPEFVWSTFVDLRPETFNRSRFQLQRALDTWFRRPLFRCARALKLADFADTRPAATAPFTLSPIKLADRLFNATAITDLRRSVTSTKWLCLGLLIRALGFP